MSGKYTFTKVLKEVRFHLCQTSEHSAATRLTVFLAIRDCHAEREADPS